MSDDKQPTTEASPTFGVRLGEVFLSGIKGYAKNVVPLSLASLATLGTYLAFRFPAQRAFLDEQVFTSIGLDLVGMILASVIAHPWYSYSLDAEAGRPIDLIKPFRTPYNFYVQAVASFWFWAGILLGLRYLFGLPSVIVLLFYAFYGYIVADGRTDSGLKALGHSARLGEKKRVGLFAIAGILFVFNLFGAIAIGFSVTPLTIGLAVLGVVITSSITLVGGARIYRTFAEGVEF